MKSNHKYWEKRAKKNLLESLKSLLTLNRDLKKEYKRAIDEIETKIVKLYSRYSNSNDMSYKDAKKYLSDSEFKEWRMSILDYITKIESTGNEELLQELNTLAMKSRISRLEELLYQVSEEINSVTLMQHQRVTELLKNTYKENYYKTIFDMQQYHGIGTSFAHLDSKDIKKVLNMKWSGNNYSKRIWDNRKKLKNTVKQELTQMLIQGKSNREVAKNIAKRMESNYRNAIRLVNTEHAYIMAEASAKGYEETDVEKYEILATLDVKTSSVCKAKDGEVYNVKNKKTGINFPPFHPHCRTTTVPYFDDDITNDEVRSARNSTMNKYGKTYEVPSNMKYEEWYEEHINKNKYN